MLSIVKMDLDSEIDTVDSEEFTKEEVLDIREESFEVTKELSNEDTMIFNSLELIPVVYTTRLDDMVVLKSDLTQFNPQDVTAKILKESKPKLTTYPSKDFNESSQKTFLNIKAKLHKVYRQSQRINLKPIPPLQIGSNSNKCEVPDKQKATCKYSELLKLCRPLSIVLSRQIEYQGTKSIAIHGDRVLKTNRVTKCLTSISLDSSSSDDDQPLITLKPETNSLNCSQENSSKLFSALTQPLKSNYQLLVSGAMEIKDVYSKEYSLYCTDKKADLIYYYKDTYANAHKYVDVGKHQNYRVIQKSCCWYKRNKFIQSLYPKVLQATNLRFMKNLHTCAPGKCCCCCRKYEHYDPPNFEIARTNSLPIYKSWTSSSQPAKGDSEDLEDKIKKSVLINKVPNLNDNESPRNLIVQTNSRSEVSKAPGPTTLIEKALTYQKPSKKHNNAQINMPWASNNMPSKFVILSNLDSDEKEIYEVNKNGELKSYGTFKNDDNRDNFHIQKMSQKIKSQHDICCWFKREEVIAQLLDSKYLHPSTAIFVRKFHKCVGGGCSCCCKLNYVKGCVPPIDIFAQHICLRNKTPILNTGKKQSKLSKDDCPVKENLGTSSNVPDAEIIGDDDCEIVSVKQAPICAVQPKFTEINFTPNIINNEDLSEEVNTLINSILERFKDVRLTINSDGKVAAALNTPINTLTTVELKVLANILSYAQSQINLLGLNSNMSLSSVINLKMSDVQSTTPIDYANIYKEFVNNVNLNKESEQPSTPKKCTIEQPSVSEECVIEQPSDVKSVAEAASTINVNSYHHYSESLHKTNTGFNDSFASFLSENCETDELPMIQNVFSLKDQEIFEHISPATSGTNAHSCQESITDNISTKRVLENSNSSAPKRIRVVSPSKLCAPSIEAPSKIFNKSFKPIQVFQTQNIDVPLLSNSSFRVVSVANNKAKPGVGTSESIVSITNSLKPVSNPLLVVSPMTTPKVAIPKVGLPRIGILKKNLVKPVKVPVSSVTTPSTPTVDMQTVYANPSEDDDNDDCCILGV